MALSVTPTDEMKTLTVGEKIYEVVDDQAREDVSEIKANLSQLPTDGVAASAKQLLSSNGTDNTEPYMFRAVPVNADRAELNAVVGGSVAWNQLCKPLSDWGVYGITKTVDESGVATLINTSANSHSITQPLTATVGHVYLMRFEVHDGGVSEIATRLSIGTSALSAYYTTTGSNVWGRREAVAKLTTNPSPSNLFFYIMTGDEGVTVQIRNINLIDLTQLFGSTIADHIISLGQATAGAGIAWFRKLFPNDYYPYDAGTLKSVEGVSVHEMVGFNLLDEVWEQGVLNSSGGVDAVATRRTTKNFIRVLPNTQYCIKISSGGRGRGAFYNSDKSLISYYADFPMTGAESVFPNNGAIITTTGGWYFVFVTPANAQWFKYSLPGTNTTDICINLSDPAKNGTYEPYEKHSYALDPTVVLRGIPKLSNGELYYDGDRYLPDGKVKRRYGIVDLGTLSWVSTSTAGTFIVNNMDGVISFPNTNADSAKIICPKYLTSNYYDANGNNLDKVIYTTWKTAAVKYLAIKDSAYTDATAFKASLSGVMLVYEVATPTTETAGPYQETQIVDDFGTEEYVTTGIVPVGHVTKYQPNLRAKLEMSPDSPDGDGDYIVRQANGENSYIALASTTTIQDILARLTALEGNTE